jgi:hypothetical protein
MAPSLSPQTHCGPSGSGPGRSSCRVIPPGPTTAAGYATARRDFVPWRFGCTVGGKIVGASDYRSSAGARAPRPLASARYSRRGLYPVELHHVGASVALRTLPLQNGNQPSQIPIYLALVDRPRIRQPSTFVRGEQAWRSGVMARIEVGFHHRLEALLVVHQRDAWCAAAVSRHPVPLNLRQHRQRGGPTSPSSLLCFAQYRSSGRRRC